MCEERLSWSSRLLRIQISWPLLNCSDLLTHPQCSCRSIQRNKVYYFTRPGETKKYFLTKIEKIYNEVKVALKTKADKIADAKVYAYLQKGDEWLGWKLKANDEMEILVQG